ncbi:hypothetical protein EK904_001313 [Melospiza melodia maxima]|nr:hypothetical protein EK904_001313 [Melospiza melodia maxima]
MGWRKKYAMFLSLVFLAELVAGISGFVFRHEIKDTFLRTYTEAIQNYNKNDERSHAVDNVQESLSCCGIQSYTNWSTSPYFFKHGIPTSCCMNSSDCNTQDLRNMTVAATKSFEKCGVQSLCEDQELQSWRKTAMNVIAHTVSRTHARTHARTPPRASPCARTLAPTPLPQCPTPSVPSCEVPRCHPGCGRVPSAPRASATPGARHRLYVLGHSVVASCDRKPMEI